MNSPAAPMIAVIIVNYRTGPLVLECLESLEVERLAGANLRVVVVDNASADGSAQLIAAALEERSWSWASLVRSPRNRGFGDGCNQGIDHALGRHPGGSGERPALVWLLNPDTQVRPGASHALARFMDEHRAAGIAGTALLLADGTPWPFAFRFPGILGEVERGMSWGPVSRLLANSATPRRMGDRPQQVDWVSGASLAIRTELLEDGLRFDPGFFLYFEETDLCRRAAELGWQTWYVPEPVVLHLAGQSTGVTSLGAEGRRLPAYWFESRRRYFVKNHGRVYAMGADLAWIAAHLLSLCKPLLGGGIAARPARLLPDFVRHSTLAVRR